MKLSAEDATNLFAISRPFIPSDIQKSPWAQPLTAADFNTALQPRIIERSTVRDWLRQGWWNKPDAYSWEGPIPYDRKAGLFRLPPALSTHANLIHEMMCLGEEMSVPGQVKSFKISAFHGLVGWGESQLSHAWHHDDSGGYDDDEKEFDIMEASKDDSENGLNIAVSYPFTTEFNTYLRAQDVRPMSNISFEDSKFIVRPTRGHYYAWRNAQVHRSPNMPASKEECLELLKNEPRDLVRHLVRDEGVIRSFVQVQIGRYHPGLKYPDYPPAPGA
ncbi:MAG TPA: hypothetical protein VFR09_09500 [Alphaproteobacteria bacterium]|nr:hypothetical protein [Alphaproteobacteria bacterium]